MTSSYSQQSVVVKTLHDIYSPPQHKEVNFNHPYKLLVDNGLSLTITDRVWLDSEPTDIVFIDPKTPQSKGAVAFNQEFLIKAVEKDDYLAYDGKLVTFGQSNGSEGYRWRAQGKEGTLTTKDAFSLWNLAGNTAVGPLYSETDEEFRLSGLDKSRFLVYNF
jgi:hypothetical protein